MRESDSGEKVSARAHTRTVRTMEYYYEGPELPELRYNANSSRDHTKNEGGGGVARAQCSLEPRNPRKIEWKKLQRENIETTFDGKMRERIGVRDRRENRRCYSQCVHVVLGRTTDPFTSGARISGVRTLATSDVIYFSPGGVFTSLASVTANFFFVFPQFSEASVHLLSPLSTVIFNSDFPGSYSHGVRPCAHPAKFADELTFRFGSAGVPARGTNVRPEGDATWGI